MQAIHQKLSKCVCKGHLDSAVHAKTDENKNSVDRLEIFQRAVALKCQLPLTKQALDKALWLMDPKNATIDQLSDVVDLVFSNSCGPILIDFKSGPGRLIYDKAVDVLEQRGAEGEMLSITSELAELAAKVSSGLAPPQRLQAVLSFRQLVVSYHERIKDMNQKISENLEPCTARVSNLEVEIDRVVCESMLKSVGKGFTCAVSAWLHGLADANAPKVELRKQIVCEKHRSNLETYMSAGQKRTWHQFLELEDALLAFFFKASSTSGFDAQTLVNGIRDVKKAMGAPAASKQMSITLDASLPAEWESTLMQVYGGGLGDDFKAQEEKYCKQSLLRLQNDICNTTPSSGEENSQFHNLCSSVQKLSSVVLNEADSKQFITLTETLKELCSFELCKRSVCQHKQQMDDVPNTLHDKLCNNLIGRAQRSMLKVVDTLDDAEALLSILKQTIQKGKSILDADELALTIKNCAEYIVTLGQQRSELVKSGLNAEIGKVAALMQTAPSCPSDNKEKQLNYITFMHKHGISQLQEKLEDMFAKAKQTMTALNGDKNSAWLVCAKAFEDQLQDIRKSITVFLIFTLLNNKKISQVASTMLSIWISPIPPDLLVGR